MTTFSADWFTHNIPNWEVHLAEFKGKPNLSFLEIGCFEGRATLWLLENILTAQTSKIMVIDPFKQTENYAKYAKDLCTHNYRDMFDKNTEPYQDKIIVNPSYSFPALSKMVNDYKNSFDMVYIDGDHTSKGCLQDMILSWELLRPKGIMIVDDYEWAIMAETTMNPKIGINAFLSIYEGEYEILLKAYQVILRKNEKS